MTRRLSRLATLALSIALVLTALTITGSPASAEGPDKHHILPGQTVQIDDADGKGFATITVSASRYGAPKGAMILASTSSYIESLFIKYSYCNIGTCEVFRYYLHTNYLWDGGFLYDVNETAWGIINATGWNTAGNYYGHFTTGTGANGWATNVQSYGYGTFQSWLGPIGPIYNCTIHLMNNVNGSGGAYNNWDQSGPGC